MAEEPQPFNPDEWRFFVDCLRDAPGVADYDRIQDRQTSRLLEETFARYQSPLILDYGCGALRHLFALLTHFPDVPWRYVGVDREPTRQLHPDSVTACEGFTTMRDRWELLTIGELRHRRLGADVAFLVNVVHEMPLGDLAAALQDIRLSLNARGSLLLMDMGMLPEGEPRFVPIVESDLPALLPVCENLSFVSRRGIPIVFAAARQSDLLPSRVLRARLQSWMIAKRDALATLGAIGMDKSPSTTRAYGLGENSIFNFLYLNTVVANAAYRVAERRSGPVVTNEEFSKAGSAILRHVIEGGMHPDLRVDAVYDALVAEHGLLSIDAALNELARPAVPSVFFATSSEVRGELDPTEFCDWLEDRLDKYPVLSGDDLLLVLTSAYQDWNEEQRY